jgi:hypothetical protein
MHGLIRPRTDTVIELRKFHLMLILTLLALLPVGAGAGGGLVIEDDVCIIRIDFYSAHFTAYQPASSANEQFCQELPETGQTIFVLDYLHQSLKEVPVEFRIIRDVTGQGRFVKLKHVEAIEDLEGATVFYQPPVIRPDASFIAEHDFTHEGAYIGIVSAGHPVEDTIYTAVFPFEVGGGISSSLALAILALLIIGMLVLWRLRRAAKHPEAKGGSR